MAAPTPSDPLPGLPIKRPVTRSIDSKTIADRFNQGVATVPDYQFGDRKFYQ